MRFSAARAETSNAEKEFTGILDEADKVGFVDLHLEATMAIADLQLQRGEQERARVLLGPLQADAAAHGFNLTATKAETRRTRLASPKKPQLND